MEEVWKPYLLNGDVTMYLISNYGKAISFWKGVPLILSPLCSKNRAKEDKIYKHYMICVDGRQYRKLAHRLVAEIFIPNPNNYPFINHIDGDPSNNCVLNLEWCTAEMNQQHAVRTGLKIEKKGALSGKAKRIGRFKEDVLIKEYGYVTEVLIDGFYPTRALRAAKNNVLYRGYNWKYLN